MIKISIQQQQGLGCMQSRHVIVFLIKQLIPVHSNKEFIL